MISLSYPLSGLPQLLKEKPLSVAIGHFDGVHRGHQEVIRRAVKEAKQAGIASAVMTFNPHPKEVLGQGDQYFRSITPLEQKTALFKELGADFVLVMNFDKAFASVTPQMFVSEVLHKLSVQHVAVGFDFTFGFKGAGNTDVLKELCGERIAVHVIEPFIQDGRKVSSSSVREALEEGNIAAVNDLLGRSYEIEGVVVHGDGRGKTIGYATANVHSDQPYVMPRLGVYAITAVVGGKAYAGVLNHGLKPTFNDGGLHPTLEAHLFDFNANIYGQTVKLQFHSFIRAERKFDNVQELIKQIHHDAEQARELLDKSNVFLR